MRLAARGVTVNYGSRVAIDGVDAEAAAGRILGVIGPNGSGKSTLIRVLAGVREPDRGHVEIDGHPLPSFSRRQRGRSIALVPQETHLSFPLRARDLVALGRAPYTGPFGWERRDDAAAVEEAMQSTDVIQLADRQIDQLSGGERQRVVLARALAQRPRVLLLDEPTSFLDLRHTVELLDLVRTLGRRDDIAVVVVLHDLNLAAMYCDQLLLLAGGKVAATGPPPEVLTYARLCEVYQTELYVAPNDVTGFLVVLPLAREHRERMRRFRGG
jgi:ABC-type cobalamin/Fe3+-siderophores transport system ATPase subunit